MGTWSVCLLALLASCTAALSTHEHDEVSVLVDWLPDVTFSCNTDPPPPSDSVHTLAPGNIDVIATIGDSLTAGFGIGAADISEISREIRGESWLAGGDGELVGADRVVTLANILKQFNPDLKGTSIGEASLGDENSGLNRAIADAADSDALMTMATDLVTLLQEDARYDWDNDWKLLSIYVGIYDICYICSGDIVIEIDEYVSNVEATLDYLHSTAAVPRLFVNLIDLADMTFVRNYSTGGLCDLLQGVTCPCAIDDAFIYQLKVIQTEMNSRVKSLIDSDKYDTRPDFTVVQQPVFQNILPPRDAEGNIETRFLSVDCFHFERAGHHAYSQLLWDCMLHSYDDKPIPEDPDLEALADIRCPTEEDPYLFTRVNSRPSKSPKTL